MEEPVGWMEFPLLRVGKFFFFGIGALLRWGSYWDSTGHESFWDGGDSTLGAGELLGAEEAGGIEAESIYWRFIRHEKEMPSLRRTCRWVVRKKLL